MKPYVRVYGPVLALGCGVLGCRSANDRVRTCWSQQANWADQYVPPRNPAAFARHYDYDTLGIRDSLFAISYAAYDLCLVTSTFTPPVVPPTLATPAGKGAQ